MYKERKLGGRKTSNRENDDILSCKNILFSLLHKFVIHRGFVENRKQNSSRNVRKQCELLINR